MKSILLRERTSIFLMWAGLTILGLTIALFLYRTNLFNTDQQIDSTKFDHFGSIIGGLVGSIWTLSSIILFYIALNEQKRATNHQREAIDDQKKAIDINIKALDAQVESLKVQTKEFELQREELAQTREVFVEQSTTLKLQQFESTFFNMLNLHHQIVNAIDIVKVEKADAIYGILQAGKTKETLLNSRDCFVFFYEKYKDFYNEFSFKHQGTRTKKDELEIISDSYTAFYMNYQSDLSHYFRNLYNILKFINKKNPGDKFFYSNLLRAQLSPFELLMLFYNCLSRFGKDKFKPLIENYYFLQNMPKKPLIDRKTHLKLYDKRAYGNPQDNVEDSL